MSRKIWVKNFYTPGGFLFLSTRFFYDFNFMSKLIFPELNFRILVYIIKY